MGKNASICMDDGSEKYDTSLEQMSYNEGCNDFTFTFSDTWNVLY